jgi:hypothetical protein
MKHEVKMQNQPSKPKQSIAIGRQDVFQKTILRPGWPNMVWSQEMQGEMLLISLRLPRNEFLHQNQYFYFI